MLLAEETAIKKNGYRNRKDEIHREKTKTTYKKVGYEKLALVENFDYLILTDDKSEDNIEKIAKEIRDKECKKPCNIDIWDDIRAYKLDRQKQKIKFSDYDSGDIRLAAKRYKNALNEWDLQNYIFVADHLVGELPFDSPNDLWYYPYKDAKYKKIKIKH